MHCVHAEQCAAGEALKHEGIRSRFPVLGGNMEEPHQTTASQSGVAETNRGGDGETELCVCVCVSECVVSVNIS